MKVQHPFRRFAPALSILLVAGVSAFAKNSRTLNLYQAATIGGKQIAAGEYKVTWESHSPAVNLTFLKGKEAVATTQGKWVQRDRKYKQNEVVYETNEDGTHRIIEIRFAGMSQAVVLGEASPATENLSPQSSATLTALSAPAVSTGPARRIQFLGKPDLRSRSSSRNLSDEGWFRCFQAASRTPPFPAVLPTMPHMPLMPSMEGSRPIAAWPQ